MSLVAPETWDLELFRNPRMTQRTIYAVSHPIDYPVALTSYEVCGTSEMPRPSKIYSNAVQELISYFEQNGIQHRIARDAKWVPIPGYFDENGVHWRTLSCDGDGALSSCNSALFCCEPQLSAEIPAAYNHFHVEIYFVKCSDCHKYFCKNCVRTGTWGTSTSLTLCRTCEPHCQRCNGRVHQNTRECLHCSNNDFERQIDQKKFLSNCWSPTKWPVIKRESEDDKAVTYGIELEVQDMQTGFDEDGNSEGELDIEHLYDVLKKAIGKTFVLKSDGSIGDSGVEVVMAPHTYPCLCEAIPKLTQALVKENFRSYIGNQCGLHIHVGKQYLPDSQVRKYKAFFSQHRAFVTALSRRKISRLNQWAGLPSGISDSTSGEGKYKAIYTGQKTSVEFRIFRGTLNHQTILASIEFLQAISQCYKRMSAERMMEEENSFAAFCSFIADAYKDRGEYPNLIRKLARMKDRISELLEISFSEQNLGHRKEYDTQNKAYRKEIKRQVKNWRDGQPVEKVARRTANFFTEIRQSMSEGSWLAAADRAAQSLNDPNPLMQAVREHSSAQSTGIEQGPIEYNWTQNPIPDAERGLSEQNQIDLMRSRMEAGDRHMQMMREREAAAAARVQADYAHVVIDPASEGPGRSTLEGISRSTTPMFCTSHADASGTWRFYGTSASMLGGDETTWESAPRRTILESDEE